MHWNHRIIEYVDPKTEEPWFAVHEVYYDDDGNPDGYTENPVICSGETVEVVREVALMMARAADKPTLRETDFKVKSVPSDELEDGV